VIVVRVELHSAITRQVTEIARMHICNAETGTHRLRDYLVRTLRGRSTPDLDKGTAQREGEVKAWPSLDKHVWNLVVEALRAMGYGR
jgi:hypothetical protein